ncbi:MAG: hisS [Rickettsiaceae bacterium]|jgi:histidyl-tRNA synthetase|nr:hisS [Rickettsiaceae bacterium]
MSRFIPVKGTKDLLPKDFSAHEHIASIAKKVGAAYGYMHMSTPIMEHTNIYTRTLGESSDVVSKEMYSFSDKGGDEITLRPEFTAGIVRAFISNGLQHDLPLKLFSYGPVFRHDRPQAGRQRQFHQLNFEYLGALSPYSDAETIKLATSFLKQLGLLEDTQLELNSLGCAESRLKYRELLVAYFHDFKTELSEDSFKRLHTNPLRILDSKDAGDQNIVAGAPKISESYTDESREYFEKVKEYLDLLSVKFVINDKLVRGLDYYNHTAFEFTTTKIGAQSTVLAGGRYDGLIKIMGGGDTPSIGFAAGIERLALMKDFSQKLLRPIYILPIGDDTIEQTIKLAETLRAENLPCMVELNGKIAKRLQRANNKNAYIAVFVGSEELKSSQVKVKNLDSGNEEMVGLDNLIDYLK